ncbi:hypothetical protein AAFP30_26415 [Gordonia sp. CPCC 205515]|uniref:hypothetical protein n=1 Tax=Gordonia sp. CPCC 205515 TaxID=3140791 RepID=UPI003AF3D3F5
MTDTPTRARRRHRPVVGPLVVLAACLAAMACTTVDGNAVAGSSDLSAKSVAADVFPAGATRVPTPAVPGALADITGRPLHGTVTPADCTPPAVPSAGAVVFVGPDPATSTATFTTAVVHADQSLDDVVNQARRCPRFVSGASPTASSLVTTDVLPAPKVAGSVRTGAWQRQVTTGATGSSAMVTATKLLMAQRNGVRVLVEYRQQGSDPISSAASGQLNALFGNAVEAAFG